MGVGCVNFDNARTLHGRACVSKKEKIMEIIVVEDNKVFEAAGLDEL